MHFAVKFIDENNSSIFNKFKILIRYIRKTNEDIFIKNLQK